VYRYLATSPQGFLQQLAVCYLKNHYFFYVMGQIREERDPLPIDRQILERYGIEMSKWGRYRRRLHGMASLQYLRYKRSFIILATNGQHRFFEAEGKVIRDAREVPIRFWRHSVSYRGGHPHVRIEQAEFSALKAYFSQVATRRPARELRQELWNLPFEPYAPVRTQLAGLLRELNRLRGAAGLSQLSPSCLRARRRVCLPFAPVPEMVEADKEVVTEVSSSSKELIPGELAPAGDHGHLRNSGRQGYTGHAARNGSGQRWRATRQG
jgi:hypothetical protein